MANRFWIGPAGGNSLWSNINNWSLTDGGATVGAIPTAADAVQFTGTTNTDCTLDTAVNKVALSLTLASGYTHTLTFNVNLSVSGSITLSSSGWTMTGSGLLRQIAAGTWTNNGLAIGVSVEIGGTTTFTSTLATALTTNGALTLTNTTSTIFSGAFDITASQVTISGTQTITLTGNIQCLDTVTISDANVINGAFQVRTSSLTVTGALTGTSTVRFNGGGGSGVGAGVWQGAAACSTSVNIDCGANSLTFGSTILFAASGTPTLTYTSGTIFPSFQILSIASSCTIAGGGTYSLGTLTLTAALTLTINTAVPFFSTLNFPNANVTLAGNAGITADTWANTAIAATAKTITLTFGNTYTCNGNLSLTGASATLTLTLVSSDGTNKVVFTLVPAAATIMDSAWLNATRIDSSQGLTIFSYKGTLTNTLNWSTTIPVNTMHQRPVIVRAARAY